MRLERVQSLLKEKAFLLLTQKKRGVEVLILNTGELPIMYGSFLTRSGVRKPMCGIWEDMKTCLGIMKKKF